MGMKLKFELVNGYGVLIDEEIKPVKGDYFYNTIDEYVYGPAEGHEIVHDEEDKWDFKVIFAEKELNLEGVPVFEWRDFEMKKKSLIECENTFSTQLAMDWWIKGYKSNPAKYTEEDLRKAIHFGVSWKDDLIKGNKSVSEFIQSLQKYPKWVVMDFNILCSNCRNEKGTKKFEDCHGNYPNLIEPKLFTNSKGEQEGTVKKLIWE